VHPWWWEWGQWENGKHNQRNAVGGIVRGGGVWLIVALSNWEMD